MIDNLKFKQYNDWEKVKNIFNAELQYNKTISRQEYLEKMKLYSVNSSTAEQYRLLLEGNGYLGKLKDKGRSFYLIKKRIPEKLFC